VNLENNYFCIGKNFIGKLIKSLYLSIKTLTIT